MSSHSPSATASELDLSKWKNLPVILIVIGAIGAGAGFALGGAQQLGFSCLVAFMFCLSLGMGGFFFTMAHHMFDASWSVATRRFCEHLGCILFPTMAVLFLPVALLAKKIYPWMTQEKMTHALAVKYPLFTMTGYYVTAAVIFLIWFIWTRQLRAQSLLQDETGAAKHTFKMRYLACTGIVLFALTFTLAATLFMKGLMDDWYSTMYGVTYFAGSMWMTLPTIYLVTMILQRTTELRLIARENTYYMIGTLFFAFTVFWAYVNFSQYFIIWNANMPEETFWFKLREAGQWKYVGQGVIIFGHFFVPFLCLLRIDWKLKLSVILPLTVWAWLMHFTDLEFQIIPALRKTEMVAPGLLVDISCVLLYVGIIMLVLIRNIAKYPVYPKRDPRLAEALGIFVPPHSDIGTAPLRAK